MIFTTIIFPKTLYYGGLWIFPLGTLFWKERTATKDVDWFLEVIAGEQGGSTEKILVGPPFSNNDVINSYDVIVTSIHPKYWWGQAPPAPPPTTFLATFFQIVLLGVP